MYTCAGAGTESAFIFGALVSPERRLSDRRKDVRRIAKDLDALRFGAGLEGVHLEGVQTQRNGCFLSLQMQRNR